MFAYQIHPKMAWWSGRLNGVHWSRTIYSEGIGLLMLLWLRNIIRDTPTRMGRLIGALGAGWSIGSFRESAAWLHAVLTYSFDVIGGPEIIQSAIRALTVTRPLTNKEVEAAERVLGTAAIRYRDVRVAHGGIWQFIFKLNRQRAFATWHTINLPGHRMNNLPLIVHELVHTCQFEKVGSIYIGQGLWAQFRHGTGAYDYGGSTGLNAAHSAGKHFSDYNREQQGQIAQDYYDRQQTELGTEAYEPFIDELRLGAL
jgi:hypothetical protein